MIIWGWRNMTRKVEGGPFHCPRCGPDKSYDRMEVNRWFTLYFIPLIPLGSQGSYVQCRMCAGTFDSRAINFDPVKEQEKFKAEFDTALLRSLLALAMAGPPITDEGLMKIAGLMHRFSGRELELSQMRDILGAVERRKMTVRSVLSPLVGSLNNHGKNLILDSLIASVPSMLPQQRKVIEEAGVMMGFDKKDLAPLLIPAPAS